MLNSEVMNKSPSWMREATEDELRDFVKVLDANESHPRHGELMKAFSKECNRRASSNYEQRARGEWI